MVRTRRCAGLQAHLDALEGSAMLASFALLVHEPMLLADHSIPYELDRERRESTLIGAAWVVADSLAAAEALEHCRIN